MRQDDGRTNLATVPEPIYPNGMIPSQNADYPAVPQTVEQVMLTRLLDSTALDLTDHQKEVLFAPVPHEIVEIRPDGKIYLPAVEFRELLVQAFGLNWELIPEGKAKIEGKIILWGFYLFIEGKPKAFAYGEMEWQKGSWTMSYGDALESAKSNALMRCCKQLHIGADLWRQSYGRKWRSLHSETYQERNKQGQMKTLWRRKDGSFGDSEGSGMMGQEPEQKAEPESENTNGSQSPEPDMDSDPQGEDLAAWRRKAFQHAKDLGMSEDDLTKMCQEHFFLFNGEAYELGPNGGKVPVTEKKQLHWSQWRNLSKHLYRLWVDAGRPKAEKKKDEEETAEEKTEESSEDKPEDINFPTEGTLQNMIDATSIMMGVGVEDVGVWLSVNYITDIENPYASTETAMKEFLSKLATDPTIAEKAKLDIPKAVKWHNAVAIPEAVGEMINALSATPHDLQAKFLADMGARTLRGIRPEKFKKWKRVLTDSKDHLDIEKAQGTEEAIPEEDPLAEEDDAQPDIPF